MRTTLSIATLFICSCFSLFGQEDLIQLKLEKGYEYYFEFMDESYSRTEEGRESEKSSKHKIAKFTVDNSSDSDILKLRLNIIKSTNEQRTSIPRRSTTDYIFPDFREPAFRNGSSFRIETFFCSNELVYLIDLNAKSIEIDNRVELLEEYRSLMKDSIYSKAEIESSINHFNKIYLPKQLNLVQHLLWFHNAKLATNNELISEVLDDKLKVNSRTEKRFEVLSADFSNLIPGEYHKKYWVDIPFGHITHFNQVRFDSITNKYNQHVGEYLYNVSEKSINLIEKKKIVEPQLYFSGKIQNSLNPKIHFRFVADPFGIRVKKETTYMDEEGNFSKQFYYNNPGFVFVAIEFPSKKKQIESFVFYCEPGDTINFVVPDLTMPENIQFFGNRVVESTLLNGLSRDFNLLKSSKGMDGESRAVFVSGLSFLRPTDLNKKKVKDLIKDITKEKSDVEKVILESRENIESQAFNYIKNEIENHYHNTLFAYFSSALMMMEDELFSSDDAKFFIETERYLNSIDFSESYNDYGLYSRLAVSSYLNYHYNRVTKYLNSGIYYRYLVSAYDVEQHIQFARMLLNGSALYREIAGVIQTALSNNSTLTFKKYKLNAEDVATRNLDLLIRQCKDEVIVKKSRELLNQYNSIQVAYELPDFKVVGVDGVELDLKNGYLGKPTIYYFLTEGLGWTGDRYMFDDLATKNQDINFIMICDGNNFQEWKEYTERAEPEAIQAFMSNNKGAVKDLFLKRSIYLVFNKNGELSSYTDKSKDALKKARLTLQPVKKKELNKSQLQLIIIVLLIFLTALLIVLLFWKWRVRQRFRKEAQNRKLRELELTAIRSQMNPHFLFNALNSVQNLVQQNKGREAHLYLADFAGLIRKVLNNSEKEEVSLAEELEMIKQYLNLEKLRFDFTFTVSVADEIDSHNTLVPSMLLQPFVENAVIHGLQSKEGSKQLNIEITKSKTGIEICIEDNGIGREAAKQIAKVKNGKGTKLMKERLEILQEKQGEKYSLETIDLEEGTRVEIVIPEEN